MSLHIHWLPLAELFDFVEDVLAWVKDRDGRYRWVNRAFLINLAMDDRHGSGPASPEDVIGKTDYDLSPAFLADQFRLDDEHVLAGNRIVDRIELVGQPDGLTAWNLTNKIPLVDPDGSVVGTAGLTRNLGATRHGLAPGLGSGFGPVLAHLRDHYHTTVTNRQLAKLAHLSVRAFERKFRACFHLTPQKYLRKLRMRMASRALVYTRESMADVAIGCGFSDQSHFTREFRRHFGRTPREYREFYALGADDAAPVTNPAAVEQADGPAGPLSLMDRSSRRPHRDEIAGSCEEDGQCRIRGESSEVWSPWCSWVRRHSSSGRWRRRRSRRRRRPGHRRSRQPRKRRWPEDRGPAPARPARPGGDPARGRHPSGRPEAPGELQVRLGRSERAREGAGDPPEGRPGDPP